MITRFVMGNRTTVRRLPDFLVFWVFHVVPVFHYFGVLSFGGVPVFLDLVHALFAHAC